MPPPQQIGAHIGPAKNNGKIESNRNVGKLGVGFESVNLLEIRSHGNYIVAHPVEVGDYGVAVSLRARAGTDHIMSASCRVICFISFQPLFD
jgi:hypothetical protein